MSARTFFGSFKNVYNADFSGQSIFAINNYVQPPPPVVEPEPTPYGEEGVWTPIFKIESSEPSAYTAVGSYIRQYLNPTDSLVTVNYRVSVTEYGLDGGNACTVQGLPFVSFGTKYGTINRTDSTPEGFTQLSSVMNGELNAGNDYISYTGGAMIGYSSGDIWSGSLTYLVSSGVEPEEVWTPTLTFDVAPAVYSVSGTVVRKLLDGVQWVATLNYRITVSDYGAATGDSFVIGNLPYASTQDYIFCTASHTDFTPDGFTQLSDTVNGVLLGGATSISFNGGGLVDYSSGDTWSGSLIYVC